MPNVINEKVQDNNYVRQYTTSRKVSSFTIKAPYVNLLPFDAWKDNWRAENIEGCYTDCHGYIHYNFKSMPYSTAKRLFMYKELKRL